MFTRSMLQRRIVWQTNVGPAVTTGLPCGNVQPSGITGTPVVDLPSRSLFFDATSYDNNGDPKHYIYSLNVDTGSLNPGWPVNVDSNAVSGGTMFSSLAQGERGALAVIGTNLYVPYGGRAGDCGTYYGWIVGIPLTNPTNVMAWATTAKGGAHGRWVALPVMACTRIWPPATPGAPPTGPAARPSFVSCPT